MAASNFQGPELAASRAVGVLFEEFCFEALLLHGNGL
jgi:hypothetical protein